MASYNYRILVIPNVFTRSLLVVACLNVVRSCRTNAWVDHMLKSFGEVIQKYHDAGWLQEDRVSQDPRKIDNIIRMTSFLAAL